MLAKETSDILCQLNNKTLFDGPYNLSPYKDTRPTYSIFFSLKLDGKLREYHPWRLRSTKMTRNGAVPLGRWSPEAR
jgi:hypothetical protein